MVFIIWYVVFGEVTLFGCHALILEDFSVFTLSIFSEVFDNLRHAT